ncbi:MAG TPA: VIT domain-containing protein, partial [Phycisphaerae bacterium]|nr:VIT domain-containing protein [Phycisphaerae bacterium]
MTSNSHPSDDRHDRQGVAEQNVERLLNTAYEPETPDPEFAEQVRARMQAAAADRSAPAQPIDLRIAPRAARALRWAAAAAALIGLGMLLSQALTFRPAETPRRDPDRLVTPRPPTGRLEGLKPRALAAAGPVETTAVGSIVDTGRGQRRRVTLADGSVVYVNEGTRLIVRGDRDLKLDRGEIYVEVAHRAAPAGGSAPFVVEAPGRKVTAVGTKFAVRANGQATDVLVTQGAVAVSGYGSLVHSGRQLACGRDGERLTAIPRASYELGWTRDLVAAAGSPLVPASEHRGGELIALDPSGQEAKLSLRTYHVDVHIEDGFARTTIDQTYFNHTPWRLEGTFYFPLPPDASISRLAMYVNGRLMEGGMAEREHARYVFEDIMYTRRDPALLEWVDGTTFKMRVFPLEGRQEKRIILSYTQRLETLYGRTEYRLPGGHSMKLAGEWSFHARVVAGAGLKWSSPTHELAGSAEGDDLLVDFKQARVIPDNDLVLHVQQKEDSLAAATELGRFSSAEHEKHRYLMVRFRPELAAVADAARQRRDWVFLFESSGDRDPLLARAQIEVIRHLLDHAEPGDRFAVLAAGTHVRSLFSTPQPVTGENVAAAVAFLESSHLVGALDLEGALAAAGDVLADGGNAHLVHVGTGIAVLGERRTDKLIATIPAGTRYVGIGVGKRWARSFMKEAAAATGGFFTQINPDENVPWRAFETASTLNTSRLMDVQVAAA